MTRPALSMASPGAVRQERMISAKFSPMTPTITIPKVAFAQSDLGTDAEADAGPGLDPGAESDLDSTLGAGLNSGFDSGFGPDLGAGSGAPARGSDCGSWGGPLSAMRYV